MLIHVKAQDGAPPSPLEQRLIEAALLTHGETLANAEAMKLVLDKLTGRAPPMAADSPKAAQTRCHVALVEFARRLFPDLDVSFTIEPGDFQR